MSTSLILPALLSLCPVLGLLAALVFFESYRLVPLKTVSALVAAGALCAVMVYPVNGWLIERLDMDLRLFSRTVSPFVEEAFKAVLLAWLIRSRRVAFLVDAAIVGFAVGCGFAVAENLYALWRTPGVDASTWIVRGFGTAIMHGGAAALFAVISLGILERDDMRVWRAFGSGYATAVLLHAAFNQLGSGSAISVPIVVVVVSGLLLVAYDRGERSVALWLGVGFDADAERLELLHSGHLTRSPTGRYLATLRRRFDGLALADLLAYLQLFTELSMRAKGRLLMRENGFPTPADPESAAQLTELDFLERSIGRTGLLALNPLLPMRRRALREMLSG